MPAPLLPEEHVTVEMDMDSKMPGKALPTVAEIRAWTDRQVIDAMQETEGFGAAWRELRSAIARAEQDQMQRRKPTIFDVRKAEAIATVAVIEAWHGFPKAEAS